jgi:hypothetical protein
VVLVEWVVLVECTVVVEWLVLADLETLFCVECFEVVVMNCVEVIGLSVTVTRINTVLLLECGDGVVP